MITYTGLREVRCCCDGRLMGYLPSRGSRGDMINFPLESQSILELSPCVAPCIETLEFEVGTIWVGNELDGQVRGLAYKSRHYPLEELRRIPQWVDLGRREGR